MSLFRSNIDWQGFWLVVGAIVITLILSVLYAMALISAGCKTTGEYVMTSDGLQPVIKCEK